jgi:sugar lactone lactonase YvrE
MLAMGMAMVVLAASVAHAENPLEVIEMFEDGIPNPAGMALTPDGDLLVISKGDTSLIYRIDLEGGENKGVTVFSSNRDFCNSRHLAVDPNGYVYLDTSRPTTLETTRRDGFSTRQLRYVGMFQVSPNGKKATRIAGIDDDTFGLAVDPDGNLFACTAEVPMDQQDIMSKVTEKSAERMFEKAEALRPRITKFILGDDSALDTRSDVVDNMVVSPAGMAFNSEGDLFFAADGSVLKVHFGFLGASRPKTFAVLPTGKAQATEYLGISADNRDNLYVSTTNPYKLAGGAIFKVDPEGEVTPLIKGLLHPTDCVADAEGNIYFADLKAEKVYQVPAEALNLQGPLRIKKSPPPVVTPPKKPVKADKPKVEAKTPAPPVVSPELDIARMEYRELSENLAAIEKKLEEKQALAYPDTIVLKGGRKMKCQIVSEEEDSVYANMSTGSAGIARSRIEIVMHGTDEEKDKALQATSEIEKLQEQAGVIKLRMRELKPPARRRKRPELYDESEYEEDEEY